MFKKDFKALKNTTPLRASDRRKVKEAVCQRFGLSEADGELLVPNGLMCAKFITSAEIGGMAYFDSKGVPLWFQTSTAGIDHQGLIPTVYTLWKRIFLPVIYTPQLVIDKLKTGADLMAPGIVSIQPSQAQQLPIPTKSLVCIVSYSRETEYPPMAVGRMAMSSTEIAQTDKGKAVFTLHTFGDVLWEKGGRGEPPKELSWVRSETEVTGEGAGGNDEEVVATTWNEAERFEHALMEDDATVTATQGIGEENEESVEPPPQAGASEPPSAEKVDTVLRTALLLFLQTKGPTLTYPYSASSLYSEGILPHRPSNIDPPSHIIKHSSFKKLKPFLKSIEKEGVLKLKEIGGELNVMAVDLSHIGVLGVKRYRTLEDVEIKEGKAREREKEEEGRVKGMDVVEYWKPVGSVGALCKAVDANPAEHYSAPALRDILNKYITLQSLVHPVERGYFTLDELLKSILLTKKEKDSTEFLKREEGLKRLLDACQSWYSIEVEGREPEMRKGKLSPISIIIKTRQGKRAVTLVTGYEIFLLNAEGLSEDLRKLCAAQTSVSPVPGKANQLEVLIQGKQGKVVVEYLIEKGVPKKWIEVDDTTEKKKVK